MVALMFRLADLNAENNHERYTLPLPDNDFLVCFLFSYKKETKTNRNCQSFTLPVDLITSKTYFFVFRISISLYC